MKMLINIDVPSLDPAINFYTRALGLEFSRLMDSDVAELTGGSSTIYLLLNQEGSKAAEGSPAVRQYSRHWTPVHIDFVVANLAEAEHRALEAGAVRESECIEWRGSRCITFSDPFGHGFCLIEFQGETYEASDA